MANDTPTRSPFKETRAEYFAALGEFIHAFAYAEASLQYALWREAGVSSMVARAVFSGVRIDQGKDLINRLIDATGRKRPPEIAAAFAQLTELTKARNDLVHYGAAFQAGGIEVSNEISAHTPDRLRVRPISKAILEAMTADTRRISAMIGLHSSMRGAKPADRAGFSDDLAFLASQAWQYKPSQQPPPQQPRRDKSPKQSRRPDA